MKDSIFNGNILGKNCTTHGVDLSVLSNGVCSVSYTMFSVADAAREGDTATVCAEGGELNLGVGVVYNDPLLVTDFASITNLIKNYNAAHILFDPALNPDAAMQNANVHLRGGRGFFDEKTGAEVTAYVKKSEQSPAIDAGDPESDFHGEPNCKFGWHGKRINLGAYGNTPWATMSVKPGIYIHLR